MVNRSQVIRSSAAISAAVITLLLFVTASYSAERSPQEITLIDNATEGYYNASIGNKLDGLLPWFPTAPASPDPTLKPAPEPDPEELVFRAGLAALLEDDPLPLGSGWGGGIQSIPRSWARTTETAIIYEIDAGPKGIKKLTGSFGVDNGIYVWVDGRYKFGAMEPGGASLGEYPNVPLDDLGPGKHYLQILREDHGAATGYAIEVSGTKNTGDTVLGAKVESGLVKYDGREQLPGQTFYPDSCPVDEQPVTPPCSPPIVMETPDSNAEPPTSLTVDCQSNELQQIIVLLVMQQHFSVLDGEPITADDLVWYLIENGYDISQGVARRCAELTQPFVGEQREVVEPNLISVWLAQGAFILELLEPGVRWNTRTPVGNFTLEEPGVVAFGFGPDGVLAGVSAYTTEVLIDPIGSSPFMIGPAQQVMVTADSVGPITDLPQVYLPAVTR